MKKKSIMALVSAAAMLLVSLSAYALDEATVLMKGKDGIVVTVADVLADARRLPNETKKVMLARPDSVRNLALAIYTRRAIAAQATKDGAPNTLQDKAAVAQAVEKVLTEIMLVKVDGTAPEQEALEKLAKAEYLSNQAKYSQPETVRARHILITNNHKDARKFAADLLEQIKGGDLGYFAKGRMVSAFEQAVFALKKVGDLTDVVETEYGFHIAKLEDRKPAGVLPYDEVKGEIMNTLATGISKDRRRALIEPLQNSVEVVADAVQKFSDEAH